MYRILHAVIMIFCAGLAYAQRSDQGEAGSVVPLVLDAQGREIGEFTTFAGQDGVLLSVGQATVVLPLKRKFSPDNSRSLSATQFEWQTDLMLDYESSDCSGDPVVNSLKGPWPAVTSREGSTVTVYFPRDVPQTAFEVRSSRLQDSGVCQTYKVPMRNAGWPTGAKSVITKGHPEPLRID
jgi:hypothetical protein